MIFYANDGLLFLTKTHQHLQAEDRGKESEGWTEGIGWWEPSQAKVMREKESEWVRYLRIVNMFALSSHFPRLDHWVQPRLRKLRRAKRMMRDEVDCWRRYAKRDCLNDLNHPICSTPSSHPHPHLNPQDRLRLTWPPSWISSKLMGLSHAKRW